MIIIRKWFINFNDNLTDLTFHSSSNFYYQIVSSQSIQRNKLCLTSLMSMSSALSLSIQYIIIYLQYVQQKLSKEKSMPVGSPHLRLFLNWDATRGTPLGQRGATRDKPPRTEV